MNIVLFVAFFGGPQRPAADPWFGRDKLLHFTASAVVQCATHAVLRANGNDYRGASRGAALATLTVGVGKEVWDHYHGGDASVRDLAWDGLYAPIERGIGRTAELLNHLQFLTIRRYLGFVFFALIILLIALALWQ